MNKIKNIFVVLLLSIVLVQCDVSDFGDINKDPNNPSNPDTRFLFVRSAKYLPGYLPGGYNSWQALYLNYASEWKTLQHVKFTEKSYVLSAYYSVAIRNLKAIIELNTDEATKSESYVLKFGSNANQIAVARILRAFFYSHMTDAVGMIPYTEALQGKDNFFPKYDTQESIYASLDNELKEAVAGFDDGGLSATYDILFNGDIANWKAMANSLRMILALRLSKVDPATGKARFADAYANPAGYIADNNQNFTYKFLREDANSNPLWKNIFKDGRDDYTPCDVIVDTMNAVNDPRRVDYFQKNKYGAYLGIPFGIANDEQGKWLKRDTLSKFGPEFIKQNTPGVLISAAYMNLTVAEAAERGWIAANAEELYKKGLQESIVQRSKRDDLEAVFNTFYGESTIAYTGSQQEKLDKIALQKWIVNYMQDGMEAFSEWRRTGVPKLTVGRSASGITALPRRFEYASDDYVTNQANYEEALKVQGPDEITTRVWWDKE